MGSLDEDQKVRLTSWLISQRMMGEAEPMITSDLEMDSTRRPSVSLRADNLLKYINSQVRRIDHLFEFPMEPPRPAPHQGLWKLCAEMLACSDSTHWGEVLVLLNLMTEEREWLISSRAVLPGGVDGYTSRLTMSGYAHLAELENPSTDSTQAFVAMWFDSSLKDAYDKGIKPAIEDSGYAPMRIDEKEHSNKIDDEIIAEIRRSKFLVADLTEGDVIKEEDGTIKGGTRGSVYYEAGFAHGLAKPVIYTCREDSLKKIHFDIRQYACIVWDTPDNLKSSLAKRISAIFGDGSGPRA